MVVQRSWLNLANITGLLVCFHLKRIGKGNRERKGSTKLTIRDGLLLVKKTAIICKEMEKWKTFLDKRR